MPAKFGTFGFCICNLSGLSDTALGKRWPRGASDENSCRMLLVKQNSKKKKKACSHCAAERRDSYSYKSGNSSQHCLRPAAGGKRLCTAPAQAKAAVETFSDACFRMYPWYGHGHLRDNQAGRDEELG